MPRLKLRHQFKSSKYGVDISAKGKAERMVDGIVFDSKKEARYYMELKLRVKAGEVILFFRQIPFHLPGNTRYVVDFLEFHTDGSVHFVDVKGRFTPEYIRNKKQVEELYKPIKIEEV